MKHYYACYCDYGTSVVPSRVAGYKFYAFASRAERDDWVDSEPWYLNNTRAACSRRDVAAALGADFWIDAGALVDGEHPCYTAEQD